MKNKQHWTGVAIFGVGVWLIAESVGPSRWNRISNEWGGTVPEGKTSRISIQGEGSGKRDWLTGREICCRSGLTWKLRGLLYWHICVSMRGLAYRIWELAVHILLLWSTRNLLSLPQLDREPCNSFRRTVSVVGVRRRTSNFSHMLSRLEWSINLPTKRSR
jgi:hypothetical protein